MVQTDVPKEQLAAFCRRPHIRRLAIFGSALRPGFGPQSDVAVLVEFEPDRVPGLLVIFPIEQELSGLFGGRKVDLRTKEDLSRYSRQRVVEEAELRYARE